MISSFFKGKKKFIVVPALLVLLVYGWPFVLAAVLARLAYKYLPFAKLRFATITAIALIALPIGSAWTIAAVNNEDTSAETQQLSEIDPTPTVTPAVNTPTPTIPLTPTPTTQQPTPTRVVPTPTKKPVQTATPAPKQVQTNFYQAPATNVYSGGDKDCSDFSTHAEAQSFYISQGGPASDPHDLDRDNDGSACDSLN